MNNGNVICVSFMIICQQVIAVNVADHSEFTIIALKTVSFDREILEYIGSLMFKCEFVVAVELETDELRTYYALFMCIW